MAIAFAIGEFLAVGRMLSGRSGAGKEQPRSFRAAATAVIRGPPVDTATADRLAAPSAAPAGDEPAHCYLCGGSALSLRFPGRGGASDGHAAYACTSFGHRSHAPIWVCRDCGFLAQWPVPDAVRLLEAYGAVEDPLYLAEKENRYLTFRRALGLLGPPRERRLLDVGAYCGIFVDVAREAGFVAEGIEPSRWAVREARAVGIPVRNETIEEAARTGARYDVLTMWDVIEHLSDPRQALRAAAELLAPGGELHVSTIDAASVLARVLGPRWPWLMDMHVVYFDRRTLPRLLEETGFRVVRRRAYTHTVSADYLLRKAAASFPAAAPLVRLASLLVPRRLPVPVNLGDNMVVSAVRR
jgi:2-polyprenyl-3-methyl-5-hydroxy-6-metoxy-1,4-benzoquinol methylase